MNLNHSNVVFLSYIYLLKTFFSYISPWKLIIWTAMEFKRHPKWSQFMIHHKPFISKNVLFFFKKIKWDIFLRRDVAILNLQFLMKISVVDFLIHAVISTVAVQNWFHCSHITDNKLLNYDYWRYREKSVTGITERIHPEKD